MSSSGPKASKTSLRWASVSLSRVSSSWLRTNVAQCPSSGGSGRCRSVSASGSASTACQRQVHLLHADEVEAHRQLVGGTAAVVRAEERHRVRVGQVHLAEQHRLAVSPAQERAQVGQVVVRVRQVRGVVLARGLEQERHGVDAEARQPELHPEPHDPGDLVADLGVGDVEVGLVLVEPVQVVLLRLPRRTPRRSSPGRGTRRPAGRRRAAPSDVGPARRTSRGRASRGCCGRSWNHGCCAEVWLTTRSAITRMPRSRAVRISSTMSPREPSRSSTP